jgi:hypothetical protein
MNSEWKDMSGRHHAVGFSPTVLITVEQKTIIKMRSPVPVIIEKKDIIFGFRYATCKFVLRRHKYFEF